MTASSIALVITLLPAQPAPSIPGGNGQIEVTVGKTTFEVFTYKPAGFKDGPLLVVFHGILRNADAYRDNAKALGDRHGALVVAPRFDEQQFPTARYQQGGLLKDGKPTPREEWTWTLAAKLVDAVRQRAGRPEMPYYLIGHSAGGQFVERLAGFVETNAVRLVAANPGTHLFPAADLDYPLGLGKLPEELGGDQTMRRYLAQPLTFYLGTADTEADKYFDKSPKAMKQGASRYERGKKCFELAEKLASQKGWSSVGGWWRLPRLGTTPRRCSSIFAVTRPWDCKRKWAPSPLPRIRFVG
jgi:poly(3-hydroxybutyrate) depolymerase